MSTIDVLAIKGIRAFSPDNEEKITFYKPLTLIVGHNGAGKTVRVAGPCHAVSVWYGRAHIFIKLLDFP